MSDLSRVLSKTLLQESTMNFLRFRERMILGSELTLSMSDVLIPFVEKSGLSEEVLKLCQRFKADMTDLLTQSCEKITTVDPNDILEGEFFTLRVEYV